MQRYARPISAALLTGFYVDDTVNRGGKVNRSAWTIYAGIGTFIDYKFVLAYSNEPLDAIHLRVAKRWLACTQANGGLFSKLAQNISSMNHVLPPPIYETLSVIQDQAPTVDFVQVTRLIREEFNGLGPDDLFDDFERDAVASASIAQVHRAKIKGTQQVVAVKVQKPKIAMQIDADLFLYAVTARLIEYFFALPIVWSVPYTSAQLRQETDFRVEARNAELAVRLTDPAVASFVSVPKIFHELSTKRVLTCEWIEGVKVTDAKAITKLGLSVAQVMQVITQYFSHQLFVTGHLHADPHPGNLMVRKLDGKLNVVVLDHGLYCELPDEFRRQYAKLWQAIIINDHASLKAIAASWGIRDSELFASFQLFRPYKASSMRPATSANVSRAEMMELQRQAKERVVHLLSDSSKTPPELSLVGRHLNLVRSLNKALGSPVNRPRIMAVYANRGALDSQGSGWWNGITFRVRLGLIELAYQSAEAWRLFCLKVLRRRSAMGFEDLIEKEFSRSVGQQLGFTPAKTVG